MLSLHQLAAMMVEAHRQMQWLQTLITPKLRQLLRSHELVLRQPRWQGAGDFCYDIVQERLPTVCPRQLLRNSPYMTQSRSDIDHERDQFVLGSMHGCQIQRCLPGMLDSAPIKPGRALAALCSLPGETTTSSTKRKLPTQYVCSAWLGRPGL